MSGYQSIVWGKYDDAEISQEFGVYGGDLAGSYQYSEAYGFPAGYHIGLDVALPAGTPIFAAQGGEVTEASNDVISPNGFRPYPVRIHEDDGDDAIYGHLERDNVKVGDTVKRGDLLGWSGAQTDANGNINSGEHLHFELRRGDRAIDPKAELGGDFSGASLNDAVGSGSQNKLLPDIDFKDIGLRGASIVLGVAVLLLGLWTFKSQAINSIAKGFTK